MSELIDLVNEQGEVVQRDVERNDISNYSDAYMQIVIAVITNKFGYILVHQRADVKPVNGGYIDHVCGAIRAGETPKKAVQREALEEVGIVPENLELVRRGVNQYGRYCHLFRGTSRALPATKLDPTEVKWATWYPLAHLEAQRDSNEYKFVDGFFEDIECAAQFSQDSGVES